MQVCGRCGQGNPDAARFCNACAAPLAAEAPSGVRKTVSILFCDLVGSTSLGDHADPEVLRDLMSRYHAELRAILERHGGTVEKFVGDAAMAVFGIPQAHEDDALRALRAASEIHHAVERLRLEVRTGINTGEVVAAAGETLVTGDAVNVAARLEQAATAGEVLIGEGTHALAGDAIRAEAIEPLALKGKAEPVRAYRLLEVLPDVPAFTRPIGGPFVGRRGELTTLEMTLARAIGDRSPQLATIVGPPGIGKSRLARELVQRADARVLVGRCLSYGEGITYWPLAEVVSQLGEVRSALETEAEGELAASRIEAALGAAASAASSEEIAWGFRRLFEALAARRSLIVVVDDIHWAEPTLLDLIEYVGAFASDAPLLLLCMARPDLFEVRPTWAAPKPNATVVTLEPLEREQTEVLVEELRDLSETTRGRIVEAAEGNPLFVEQLVAMQAEVEDGELAIPPTIQALLATRIDRLDPDERAVIERGSVEGRMFHRGSIAALSPEDDRAAVGVHLMTLVRKELIRPDRAVFPGDDGFRFGHMLIRDAAYESMPKRTRADMHERFAGWLEDVAGPGATDYEEILGYHLERSHRYRAELGLDDEHDRSVAERAAALLAASGRRALSRGDLPAAINLIERSVRLMPSSDPHRAELLVDLGIAASDAGEYPRAEAVFAEAIEWSEAAADERLDAHARLARLRLQLLTHPEIDVEDAERQATGVLPSLEASEDHLGMARAWLVLATTRNMRLRSMARAEALERAAEHAQWAGARREKQEALYYLASPPVHGPMPVEQALRSLDELLDRSEGDRMVESSVLYSVGRLEAMRGRFDEARLAAARCVEILEDLGQRPQAESSRGEDFGYIEMLAGDPVAAERELRRACDALRSMGETGIFSTLVAELALVLCELDRFDEAAAFIQESRAAAAADDVLSQARWRIAWAWVLTGQGKPKEAVDVAHEAVALLEPTDVIDIQADTLVRFARVLVEAGEEREAAKALERALELHERKGNLVSADLTRQMLAARPPA
jgi:class 3 adenylate cyclase/tetratricopeptide (TPR) repeat protein